MSKQRVIPGFGLSMGFSITYLSLIILIPLAALFIKAAGLGFDEWWNLLTTPRVIAATKLTFGASAATPAVFLLATLGLLGLAALGLVQARDKPSTWGAR